MIPQLTVRPDYDLGDINDNAKTGATTFLRGLDAGFVASGRMHLCAGGAAIPERVLLGRRAGPGS